MGLCAFYYYSFCIAKFIEFLQNYQALDKDNQKYAKYAIQLSKLAHREQVCIVITGSQPAMVIVIYRLSRNDAYLVMSGSLLPGVSVHRAG